jgi:hypothetical protein
MTPLTAIAISPEQNRQHGGTSAVKTVAGKVAYREGIEN